MTKNYSPRQLALLTALILSLPIGLAILYLQRDWIEGAVAFLIILAGSYFLVHFIIQQFIYRKIKLIYKFIYETKARRQQETYYKYILPKKSIDEVTHDVEAWGQQQKREIEMLRRNEHFRKEFLQNLSHEFKTPVFAIQGYIETLQNGALEDHDTSIHFLNKASKNVERLVNLIQDLDEISRLESGELKLNKENFIIQDLVREVFDSLHIAVEKNNIAFSFKKGCEQPIMVNADKEKVRQVITNLVENSIKYGKEGGTIVASMYNTDGRNILVEISDDGVGISKDDITRIFERFYRTRQGRSRDVTGSGLGLAICKHIIEAHGHSIHVRSTEGVGTTVGFTLSTP